MILQRLLARFKRRSVQEVFDAVIDAEFYPRSSRFMCVSLRRGRLFSLITRGEEVRCKREIKKYLDGFPSLKEALDYSRRPSNIGDRLNIYRDWANRPKLK